MYKYAMVGYYPSGVVYAVGNEGVTPDQAKEHAAEEGLECFQLFPLERHPPRGGQHGFYRRDDDGEYRKGRSRYFAAKVSPYVASLIQKDEVNE